MNSSPLISVIIPVYNTGDYIEKTIKSVLTQTYHNLEVVIVDDGSTDGSAEIIKNLAQIDSRIKYIFQQNQGVSAARNNAIAGSRGEYLAFLDSDDLWFPDKLKKQVDRILATNMEACYCGYQYFYEDSKLDSSSGKAFPKNYMEGKILIDVLKEKVSVWTSTVVVKKSIVINNAITFISGLNWAEDTDFFYRLLYKCEFCCVKEVLALYRQRPNSLSVAPNRLPEIQLYKKFGSWVLNEPSPIKYNKQLIEKAINSYKIPSVVIFCLYQKLSTDKEFKKEDLAEFPYHLVSNYKLSFSEAGIKLFIKKILIKYKYGFK